MNSFICPKCHTRLTLDNRTYRCSNGHCFDQAKEGYVNLLPINAKKSKNPGDNSKMTMARRLFLETNLYKSLAEKVSDILSDILKGKAGNILDLGCGEGYYTGIISEKHSNCSFTGLDISKVAVRYGSKRYKQIKFCTASAFQIPIADNSMDIVYRIYAPSDQAELSRVLKDNGYLITVTPGDRHLYQLREIIYDNVLNLSTKNDETDSFKLINTETLHYPMEIDNKETVKNLLDMTPFGWKIKPVDLEELLSRTLWNIESDFDIKVFRKNSKNG